MNAFKVPRSVKTDLWPWLTFDKPDIAPVEPGPRGHGMLVGFRPQIVFNVFQCTLFVASTVGKFDKDTAILLVWLNVKDLESVCRNDRKAGFQFPEQRLFTKHTDIMADTGIAVRTAEGRDRDVRTPRCPVGWERQNRRTASPPVCDTCEGEGH